MIAKLLCVALMMTLVCVHASGNLNGDYILSQTPGGKDTNKKFPTQYENYPGGAEYFEVYSPLISQLYSQVFWKGLPPVPLPAHIVKRFDGKGMAVIGFEMDQVRQTPEGDVSVPITVAYNHHFESTMGSKHTRFEKVTFDGPDDPQLIDLIKKHKDMGHGIPSHEEAWILHDLAPNNKLPTSQSFGEANGGEYRKSFHGYAPGYAQVIDSPTEIQITPMQIDTWNRDEMPLTSPSPFVPGPLPRNSLAPPAERHPNYSGLLECPLTTRVEKVIDLNYKVVSKGACASDHTITSADGCFDAASKLLGKASQWTGNDPSLPTGCSVMVQGDKGLRVSYNTQSTTVACQSSANGLAEGISQSLVQLKVKIDSKADIVTITATGPSDVWFGVGFGAQNMGAEPWTIIMEGNGNVTERKLRDQNPGVLLPSTIKVVSNTVTNGQRTVIMTRTLKGKSGDYYTFDLLNGSVIDFINAVGSGPLFAYHKNKAPASLTLLPLVDGSSDAAACVCALTIPAFGQGKGKFVYHPVQGQKGEAGSGSVNFGNYCDPQPRTDLLAQKNPTCDLRTYVGGQSSCHHMWSLLDADQEIPWTDQPLEYHLKFRFWVQAYNESYHKNVARTVWGIASPVEYDVPKCGPGVMGCKQAKDGTWIHTITGTFKGSGHLVAAHFHCHAPTCLSMAMYRNDTGELICEERPIYGGTGQLDIKKFDEPGYILQPPCLWGEDAFGLESPPDLNGVMLHSVKTSNATYGHHGEMAWQQVFYV